MRRFDSNAAGGRSGRPPSHLPPSAQRALAPRFLVALALGAVLGAYCTLACSDPLSAASELHPEVRPDTHAEVRPELRPAGNGTTSAVPPVSDGLLSAASAPLAATAEPTAPAANAGLLGSATREAKGVLAFALEHIGVRYRYGGNDPDRGFDCSGLVRWVYSRTWGIMLPHRADQIAQMGAVVPRDQLQPGDLVFFKTLRRTFSHVGIYLGDGQFLHAPSAGGSVRVENMDQTYWNKRWNGARRIDQPTLSVEAQQVNQPVLQSSTLQNTPH